jgi:H+/Cl- antiporter ClcA
MSNARQPAPPPLEANDQLVTAVITAGWAIALIVLVAVRTDIPASGRWWIWTCVTGLGLGFFGLLYVPRLKRSRERAARRRAEAGQR